MIDDPGTLPTYTHQWKEHANVSDEERLAIELSRIFDVNMFKDFRYLEHNLVELGFMRIYTDGWSPGYWFEKDFKIINGKERFEVMEGTWCERRLIILRTFGVTE